MTPESAIKEIKMAIENAPRNAYVAELHVQVLKYGDVLEGVTGKEFCEALGIGVSFGTEFAKMKKIYRRLVDAGLDVAKI